MTDTTDQLAKVGDKRLSGEWVFTCIQAAEMPEREAHKPEIWECDARTLPVEFYRGAAVADRPFCCAGVWKRTFPEAAAAGIARRRRDYEAAKDLVTAFENAAR